MIKNFVKHPVAKGVHIDDPKTTILRSRIIQEKAFLRKLHHEWYEWLIKQIPDLPGKVLELGSGGGFLRDFLPESITSDIFPIPNVKLVIDGCYLPINDQSLKSIIMVNVFHHIPEVKKFLAEAERTIRPGGAIMMIEPWATLWANFVYKVFHQEPFDIYAENWHFVSSGPLSGANGALPWIVFSRDRNLFNANFSGLQLESITLDYPLSYIASGGVSFRSFMPSWSFDLCRRFERMLKPFMGRLAMFARIVIRRS